MEMNKEKEKEVISRNCLGLFWKIYTSDDGGLHTHKKQNIRLWLSLSVCLPVSATHICSVDY